MDALLYLGFAASVAFALFCIWVDWDVSKRFIYYGRKEKTKLLQDENGYMSHWKVAVMTAIKLAPFALIFWTPWAVIWGPLVGLPHLIIGLRNRKGCKATRLSQIKFREKVKGHIANDDFEGLWRTGFNTIITRASNGRSYKSTFGWLDVAATDIEDARTKLAHLFFDDWGRLPETQAWPDVKFHPKGAV